MLLLDWLVTTGRQFMSSTYSVYLLLLLLGVIAANTAVCTLDKVPFLLRQITREKVRLKHPWLRWTVFAPTMAHLGFMLVLGGHLLSGAVGFRSSENIFLKDELSEVPQLNAYLRLEEFRPEFFPRGMPKQFYSRVSLFDSEKKLLKEQTISVNHPLFYQGAGFYQSSYGEDFDRLEVMVSRPGTRYQTLKLKEEQGIEIGEDTILKLNSITSNYRGQGYAMAYFELEKPGQFSSAPIYLVRGRNTAQLGEYTVAVTDVLTRPYTVLTINQDPGAPYVLAGASMLTLFALVTAAVDYRRFMA